MFLLGISAATFTLAIAIVLMTLGGWIAFVNWLGIYLSYRTKRFHSPAPFLGAMLLGAGMWTLTATRKWAWIAIVLDYGTLALVVALPWLLYDSWRYSSNNLLQQYYGEAGVKNVRLRLYRRGLFVIALRGRSSTGEFQLNIAGTWQRQGVRLTLNLRNEAAVFDVIQDEPNGVLRQSAGFPTWESSQEKSLVNIELVQRW